MENNQKLIQILEANNYVKHGYGFKRETELNIHWVTIFSSGKVQLFSYFDPEDSGIDEKNYDTGLLSDLTPEVLQVLITTLVSNHL